MRVAVQHIRDRLTRQEGNAVVGFLAREGHLITGSLDFGAREIVVLLLQLLQAQDIRLLLGQPVEQVGRRTFSEFTFQVAIFM